MSDIDALIAKINSKRAEVGEQIEETKKWANMEPSDMKEQSMMWPEFWEKYEMSKAFLASNEEGYYEE